jgi:hypothetical protein
MIEILIWLYGIAGMPLPLDIELELLDITNMRKSAFEYALQCSEIDAPPVNFEDLTWHILPGSNFSLTSSEGETVFLRGWFDPAGYIIYIPFDYRFDFNLAAHEILHSFGFINHSEPPFTTCDV